MAHFLRTQPIVQVNLPNSQSMDYANYAQESSRLYLLLAASIMPCLGLTKCNA